MADRDAQLERMAELLDMIRFRKLPVRLVAAAWVTSPAAARAVAEARAADMILLDARLMGGLDQVAEAATMCRERGLGTIVSAATADMTAQLALAVRADLAQTPDYLPGDPGMVALRQHMDRLAAWHSYQAGART